MARDSPTAATLRASGWRPCHSCSIGVMLKQNSYFEAFRDRHPGTLGPLRFMEFEHLRDPELRAFSSQFAGLARNLLVQLPDDPELTKALDALRTVKDRAVGLYTHLKQEGKLPSST